MPNGHNPHPPSSIPELWIHIQAEQRATSEHRQELKQSLTNVNSRLAHIETIMDEHYVRKEYFDAVFLPVRNIVYGMVGTILFTVLMGILYLVVKQQ